MVSLLEELWVIVYEWVEDNETVLFLKWYGTGL